MCSTGLRHWGRISIWLAWARSIDAADCASELIRLSFGNTIKREADIRQAHSIGINMFAFDSMAELEKLPRAAPGSGVFCRMSVTNVGGDWP
jgi:ornithine decarboxylase